MALATATVTLDIADLLGADFRPDRTSIRATTNADVVIDTAGNQIRLGSGTATLNSDGTAQLEVWIPGAGSNPASWQTSIHIDYPDRNASNGRGKKTFGPFTITADANLADLIAEMPVQPEYASAALDRIDGVEDHGDISGAVTFSGPKVSHRFDATGPTTITFDGFLDGQVVSLICFSGADDVAIVGAPDAALVDGTVWAAEYARELWVTGGGSGTPAVPDTTPPTAITDLGATGGELELTLTGTNPTDSESIARIRYRVWLTADGPSGAYATANTFPIVLPVAEAGAYTAEAYSFSAGGQQTTPDTATATVTAPVEPIAADTFTAADGTTFTGRTTPIGGAAYAVTNGVGMRINGNKMVCTTNGELESVKVTLAAPVPSTPGIRVTCDYDVTGTGGNPILQVKVIRGGGSSTFQLQRSGSTAAVSYTGDSGPTTVALAGTLVFELAAAVMTVGFSEGDAVYSGQGFSTADITDVEFLFVNAGGSIDNLVVESL